VHLQSSGFDFRKEVAAVEIKQSQRSQGQCQRNADKASAPGDRLFEQGLVAITKSVEPVFEPLLEAAENISGAFGLILGIG
jgi:hypothetical protein